MFKIHTLIILSILWILPLQVYSQIEPGNKKLRIISYNAYFTSIFPIDLNP